MESIKLTEIPGRKQIALKNEIKRQNPEILTMVGHRYNLSELFVFRLARHGAQYWKNFEEKFPLIEIS